MDDEHAYHMIPIPWNEYGGLVGGYLYVEGGLGYNLTVSHPIAGDYLSMVLDSNLQVMQEFIIYQQTPSFSS